MTVGVTDLAKSMNISSKPIFKDIFIARNKIKLSGTSSTDTDFAVLGLESFPNDILPEKAG